MKKEEKQKKSKNLKTNKNGITLIALVITYIVPYDKIVKCGNL